MIDLVIIGGGMSGLVLAVLAGRAGYRTVLLEKTDRVGKKILATGNGRCNLANRFFSMDHFHGSALPAAEEVLSQYGPDRIEAFWEDLGITYREEEDGKCYPRSLQASSVLNVLRRQTAMLEENGILKVIVSAPAVKIRFEKKTGSFQVVYRAQEEGKQIILSEVRNVTLASGGKASPRLGSAGEGYRLAEELGIRVTSARPGLCRLLSDEPAMRRLSGVKIRAAVSLYAENKKLGTIHDEILFTDEGVSGPSILELSRMAGDLLEEGKRIRIGVDFCEEFSSGELFAAIEQRFSHLGSLPAEDALEGWIHKKLIPEVLRISGIGREEKVSSLPKSKLGALCRTLKDYPVSIQKLDSFRDAQVSVGGIAGEELGDGLMSRRYPGLFFAGEVIDLDGDCGGYNLMWAQASAAWIADHLL